MYGKVASVKGIGDLAGIPICGAAGDQQAALFGQACLPQPAQAPMAPAVYPDERRRPAHPFQAGTGDLGGLVAGRPDDLCPGGDRCSTPGPPFSSCRMSWG